MKGCTMPIPESAISETNSEVRHMIDIYLLQQLVAFADCGTLSAASETLHTSQPAMTRSMKKLEDELGIPLFIRSRNHLALNDTGLHAAQYARQVLSAAMDFEAKTKAYDRSLHTISIGFCAPVPQTVLTPIINNIFSGMTVSSDMMDDAQFLSKLENGIYQLAVVHEEPIGDLFYYKKCGHEDLYISLDPSNPLAFYPEIHLKDLNGMSILLLQEIGFWSKIHREQTPDSNYLIQTEYNSLQELTANSTFPVFASSYYIRRGEMPSGRINIPITDPECHTDFYLVCLKENHIKYKSLFDRINDSTIK